MRQTQQHHAVATVKAACRVTTTFARLHIDLQRVTTALCPASPHAVVRRSAVLHVAV